MLAYKLLRVRKTGTLGSLFINRKAVLPVGEWLTAEDHPTPGYARRPGFHAIWSPNAPHLSMNGRQWWLVEIEDYEVFQRPAHQGGTWFLAKRMKLIKHIPVETNR